MPQQQHLSRLSICDAMCFLLPGSLLPLNYLQEGDSSLSGLFTRTHTDGNLLDMSVKN